MSNNLGFSIVVVPVTPEVVPGTSMTCTVIVASSGGFSNPVNLLINGLPTGIVGTFSPAIIANANGNSTLTLTASSGVPIGVYSFSVLGTSGSNNLYEVTVTLIVANSYTVNAPFQLLWTDEFNNPIAQGIVPISFPATSTPALQLQVATNAAALGTFEKLTNVSFFITGTASDVNTVQNIWTTLGGTTNSQVNGGLDISFDFGQTFTRFDATHGVEAKPATWIPLPVEAVGAQGAAGTIGAFDIAHFIVRYVIPPGAIQFGKLDIRLSLGFDII